MKKIKLWRVISNLSYTKPILFLSSLSYIKAKFFSHSFMNLNNNILTAKFPVTCTFIPPLTHYSAQDSPSKLNNLQQGFLWFHDCLVLSLYRLVFSLVSLEAEPEMGFMYKWFIKRVVSYVTYKGVDEAGLGRRNWDEQGYGFRDVHLQLAPGESLETTLYHVVSLVLRN